MQNYVLQCLTKQIIIRRLPYKQIYKDNNHFDNATQIIKDKETGLNIKNINQNYFNDHFQTQYLL